MTTISAVTICCVMVPLITFVSTPCVPCYRFIPSLRRPTVSTVFELANHYRHCLAFYVQKVPAKFLVKPGTRDWTLANQLNRLVASTSTRGRVLERHGQESSKDEARRMEVELSSRAQHFARTSRFPAAAENRQGRSAAASRAVVVNGKGICGRLARTSMQLGQPCGLRRNAAGLA